MNFATPQHSPAFPLGSCVSPLMSEPAGSNVKIQAPPEAVACNAELGLETDLAGREAASGAGAAGQPGEAGRQSHVPWRPAQSQRAREFDGISMKDFSSLGREEFNRRMLHGNFRDDDVEELGSLWKKKKTVIGKELIDECRRFVIAIDIFTHAYALPAMRARGAVFIVGLADVGLEMLSAFRAEGAPGEIVRFLGGHNFPNV